MTTRFLAACAVARAALRKEPMPRILIGLVIGLGLLSCGPVTTHPAAQAPIVWRIHCQSGGFEPAHTDFQPTASVWDSARECVDSNARAIKQWQPYCDQGLARACAEMQRVCRCEPERVE
jgi:hypothetical protein